MVLTAVAMAFQLDIRFQTAIADHLPGRAGESRRARSRPRDAVDERLAKLRPAVAVRARGAASTLDDYGPAPDFAGNDRWFNSKPLTLAGLRGRVVLIDFWTYTCINCIRTLPHLVAWDKAYRDAGLTIVGVHSPEFSVRAQGVQRRAGDQAERHRVSGRAGQRDGDLERVEQPVLAGEVPDRRARDTSATRTSARATTSKTEAAIRALLREPGAMAGRRRATLRPGRAGARPRPTSAPRGRSASCPAGSCPAARPTRRTTASCRPTTSRSAGNWTIDDESATAGPGRVRCAAPSRARTSTSCCPGRARWTVTVDGRLEKTVQGHHAEPLPPALAAEAGRARHAAALLARRRRLRVHVRLILSD